jgi:hypothetical protein
VSESVKSSDKRASGATTAAEERSTAPPGTSTKCASTAFTPAWHQSI